jgi:hypothetical protein
MHKEETQEVESQVAFDIDSFLGFAHSLAMARERLWYQPVAQMRQNMATDVHLEIPVFTGGDDTEQPSRRHLAMLKDVPHFLLGRVCGAHDITVHVLFPHLPVVNRKFQCMTKEQSSRWLDQVFHPAVHQYCDAHYTQHLPASYRHALANSLAPRLEGRQAMTASYEAQKSIGYHLQSEYLGQIWTEVLRMINTTPGLQDFREPQIFFSAKGTKLQFKSSREKPTLLDAMEGFQCYLERVVDFDFIYPDRLYVDVGKEICAQVSLLRSQSRHVDDEAQVYMWKRCCLSKYIQWMYDGNAPAAGGHGQRYYTQSMLHDACSLTSVTPKRSMLRSGGFDIQPVLWFCQEVYDATKQYPFDNDGLEELALDPQIRQGARHAVGGNRREAKVIKRLTVQVRDVHEMPSLIRGASHLVSERNIG